MFPSRDQNNTGMFEYSYLIQVFIGWLYSEAQEISKMGYFMKT